MEGVFEKLLTEHVDVIDFDESLIPDLSAFTKEQLVSQLLQFQLKEMATYYQNSNDLADQKFGSRDDKPGRRDRDSRDRERGSRDGGSFRDRGDRGGDRREGGDRNRDRKPKRRNEDMVRFFFNLGKKDQLKKVDMLEIINKATSKSKKRADIGEIEILDKFSFFEIEKSYKNEVLDGLTSMKFRGKEMRAEVAN